MRSVTGEDGAGRSAMIRAPQRTDPDPRSARRDRRFLICVRDTVHARMLPLTAASDCTAWRLAEGRYAPSSHSFSTMPVRMYIRIEHVVRRRARHQYVVLLLHG